MSDNKVICAKPPPLVAVGTLLRVMAKIVLTRIAPKDGLDALHGRHVTLVVVIAQTGPRIACATINATKIIKEAKGTAAAPVRLGNKTPCSDSQPRVNKAKAERQEVVDGSSLATSYTIKTARHVAVGSI